MSRRALYLVFAFAPVVAYAASYGLANLTLPEGSSSLLYTNSPWFIIAFTTGLPILFATPFLLMYYFVDFEGASGLISGRRKILAFLTAEAVIYIVFFANTANLLNATWTLRDLVQPVLLGIPAVLTLTVGYLLRDKQDLVKTSGYCSF